MTTLLAILLLVAIVAAEDTGNGANKEGNNRDGNPQGKKEHKVTLCHATASASNPYVMITVDTSSVNNLEDLNGHGLHDAAIFDPETNVSGDDWGDIIPPFEGFEGLNWNDEGKAFLERRCKRAKTDTSSSEEEESGSSEEPEEERIERQQSELCHDRCAAQIAAEEDVRHKKEKEAADGDDTTDDASDDASDEDVVEDKAGKAAGSDRKRSNANAQCHQACVSETKERVKKVRNDKATKNLEDVADDAVKETLRETTGRACTKAKGKGKACNTTTVQIKGKCEKLAETKRSLAMMAERTSLAFVLEGCGETFDDEDQFEIDASDISRKRESNEQFTGTVTGAIGDERGAFKTEGELVAATATLPADDLEVILTIEDQDASITGPSDSSATLSAIAASITVVATVALL